MNYALVFLASAALAAILVPLTRVLARVFGAVDHPGERKIHSAPIPRLGGVAVAAAFWSVVLGGFVVLAQGYRVEGIGDVEPVSAKLFGLLFGSLVAFSAGLLDDVFGSRFPFWAKLFGQTLAAGIVVAAGVSVSIFPWPALNAVVSVVWIVGITNAFNLLDNMDGLCAGVAVIAATVLFANSRLSSEHLISAIAMALIGALAGFLLHNFHPATVFLGDSGSHFIGFMLASLLLLERYVTQASSTLFPVLMPLVLLAVPIIDTISVIVIRLREGRPVYVGDARHLSHTLVRRGFTQRGAVFLIWLMTLGLGLAAMPLRSATPIESLFIVVQLLAFVAVILFLMFSSGARAEAERGTGAES